MFCEEAIKAKKAKKAMKEFRIVNENKLFIGEEQKASTKTHLLQ